MKTKVIQKLNQWLQPQEEVIVGISGGADSVAIAHILDAAGYQMILIHINFHLRDSESDQDEEFVRQLHQRIFQRHQLIVRDVDTISYAKEHGVSIEMAARDLRYGIFREYASQKKIRWIVVGHHADDQVETALLNLSRGTGGQGLAGMSVANAQGILRPMLDIWRAEIEEYLQRQGISYCTDSTNKETIYKRNQIRHKVIPQFEQINPSFKETLLQSMEYFREEQEILDEYADKVYDSVHHPPCQMIDFSLLEPSSTAHALLSRKLRAMSFTKEQISNILRFNKNDKCTSYYSTDGSTLLQIYRGYGFISQPVEFESEVIPLPSAGIYNIEGIGTLSIGGFYGSLKIKRELLRGQNLELRTATAEDRFQPLGMKKGSKKVFRYLGEKGIPECYRGQFPVLVLKDTIVAVLPFEISETARVNPQEEGVLIDFSPEDNTFGNIVNHFHKQKC